MKKLALALLTLSLMPAAFGATFELGDTCKNEGKLGGSVSVIEWKGNVEIQGKVDGKKVIAVVRPSALQDYSVENLIQEFRFNMRDGYTTRVEFECVDNEGNNVSEFNVIYSPKE